MRAEVERAYQTGGDVLDEEGIVTVDQLIPDPMPRTEPTTTRELIDIHREQQLAKLKGGQERIAARRAEMQKKDEQARWFALAQGMLAPTKTGGFGESLGTTAGLLRQEQELSRQGMSQLLEEETLLAGQEADVGADYISQLQAQERIEKQVNRGEFSRPRPIGTEKLYPHPDDPSKLARGQQIWRPDMERPALDEEGNQIFDEDGEPVIQIGGSEIQYLDEVGPDGSIPYAVDRLDYERNRILTTEKKLAEAEAGRLNNDIMAGREAWPVIQKYERVVDLLNEVEKSGMGTGGWVALLQGAQEWFGVDTKGVTTLGQIRHGLGQAVLEGLQHFPGQISEGERKYMEALETGLSKPLGVNMALIEEGLRIQRARHRRGVRAARSVGLPLDLEAMGVDPNAPNAPPVGSVESILQDKPGSSKYNPLVIETGDPEPPHGTWIVPPSGGKPRQWQGIPPQ